VQLFENWSWQKRCRVYVPVPHVTEHRELAQADHVQTKIFNFTTSILIVCQWKYLLIQTSGLQFRVEALYVPQILGFEQVVGTDELVSAILRHVRFIACVPLPHVFEQSVAATYGPNWQTRKNEKKTKFINSKNKTDLHKRIVGRLVFEHYRPNNDCMACSYSNINTIDYVFEYLDHM